MSRGKGANLQLNIELEIRDRNGKIITKKRQVSKSLLKNFLAFLRTSFSVVINSGTTSVTLKDTSGANKSFYVCIYFTSISVPVVHTPMPTLAGGSDANYGIQIGRGDTAVTRDDFQLATLITEGTGVNQMNYGAMTVEAVNGTPPQSMFRLIRVITNNSAATITVKEIGLVMGNRIDNSVTQTAYLMIARDVLTSPIDVPVGSTLTVRYIFSVTA